MNADRKAEIKRTYKETVQRRGVFKIHCTTTGRTWVESSPTIDSIKNRIWFQLGFGNHPNRDLQQAWNESGKDTFEYEIVEVFPADKSALAIQDLMKERKQYWVEKLGAEPLQ